ncbi:unnamed protein product [Rhizophagus irregularis]|nr:unnamed protein product [Rhizophagus irregularis]
MTDKGEIMVGIDEIKEEIQTNEEIVEFGHRIGKKEIESRFNEFWDETIANKENKWKVVRFQKSMRYTTKVTYPKYKDGWKNNQLTEEIIEEFITSKQFEIRLSDARSSEFNIGSSEVSENDSENDDKEKSSMSIAEIKEKLEKKGIPIEELKIERAIRLGYTLKQILVCDRILGKV